MTWWMILGGTLLAALGFGLGSWRSGRALDDAYDQGWRASDREAWRDGYEAGCDDTEASMVPRHESDDEAPGRQPDVVQVPRLGGYIRSPIEHPDEPNGSRLMNDHQVRAELAALAEDVPRPDSAASLGTGPLEARPVHTPRAAASGLAEVSGPGYLASAITDTHWIRLVGQEFYDTQRAWSEDLDWRLLTWAVGLMGKEGAGRMLEAAR